jgi:hypothetical protein
MKDITEIESHLLKLPRNEMAREAGTVYLKWKAMGTPRNLRQLQNKIAARKAPPVSGSLTVLRQWGQEPPTTERAEAVAAWRFGRSRAERAAWKEKNQGASTAPRSRSWVIPLDKYMSRTACSKLLEETAVEIRMLPAKLRRDLEHLAPGDHICLTLLQTLAARGEVWGGRFLAAGEGRGRRNRRP